MPFFKDLGKKISSAPIFHGKGLGSKHDRPVANFFKKDVGPIAKDVVGSLKSVTKPVLGAAGGVLSAIEGVGKGIGSIGENLPRFLLIAGGMLLMFQFARR